MTGKYGLLVGKTLTVIGKVERRIVEARSVIVSAAGFVD